MASTSGNKEPVTELPRGGFASASATGKFVAVPALPLPTPAGQSKRVFAEPWLNGGRSPETLGSPLSVINGPEPAREMILESGLER